MDILDVIRNRRSVREFLDGEISKEEIDKILEAGRWAPSGLNNQPWRFSVLRDKKIREELAKLTHYGDIIRDANVCIAVFLDKSSSYDRTKDIQAIGACIQNMLLEAHSLGLGACWLGEILKNKNLVNRILNIPDDKELMAVIAVGYPSKRERKSTRKSLGELLL
ncbi:MAG: nitroreductase family protein [Candidatus Altiarchaeales archaeon]|nr:MAG: nitroreductase family protein [Candidatus Altiarchaeales archaeon]RLI93942.1 MAG: nitroreductase family protein [Candidatus Altiarchaeales archaeon]RLI95002.1 MAG: nitroreductase family protein [Candidatus Altiarchaeales archaeon]HDO82667.1 nitroreductase family protein [Candidatus Altiarchaeales archaeon]HEX55316.1 nitroreductase family protein [Candidatus Altiarchaeales archaeon]